MNNRTAKAIRRNLGILFSRYQFSRLPDRLRAKYKAAKREWNATPRKLRRVEA